MQSITLFLPKYLKTAQLRLDLEEIVTEHKGKKATYFAFSLPYAVGLAQVYEFPSRGTVITITNDLNIFCDKHPWIPGAKLYYNARILFLGFNEETLEFQWMKDRFEGLNGKYQR